MESICSEAVFSDTYPTLEPLTLLQRCRIPVCSFTSTASSQDEEAERWYWQALRVSPLEGRDSCLSNLALLMRANSSRIEEAVDLISR